MMAPLDGKTSGKQRSHEYGEGIDAETFEQVLEMDDSPSDREFSKSIFHAFIKQAEETFAKMDEAILSGDLDELSALGHYLKGSSATLGLIKVRDGCEKIQRWGKLENEDGTSEPDRDLCLKRTQDALAIVKKDYKEAELSLTHFYMRAEA